MIPVDDTRPRAEQWAEQLQRWVDGDSQHLGDKDDPQSQCVPDFSCCQPHLVADPAVRRAFAAADEDTRLKFLGHFLGAAFAAMKSTSKVKVVSGDPEDQS